MSKKCEETFETIRKNYGKARPSATQIRANPNIKLIFPYTRPTCLKTLLFDLVRKIIGIGKKESPQTGEKSMTENNILLGKKELLKLIKDDVLF